MKELRWKIHSKEDVDNPLFYYNIVGGRRRKTHVRMKGRALGERTTMVGSIVSYKEEVVKWEGIWKGRGEF